MKLKVRDFKSNTMLPIYDHKQNKTYMVNVTTRKVYVHSQKFKSINTIVTALTGGALYRAVLSLQPRLYLNESLQRFKPLLAIVAITIGFVLLVWLSKKKQQPQFKDYVEAHKDAKEVKYNDEIEKIFIHARNQIQIGMCASLGLLIWCIWLFNQFFSYSNMGTYVLATVILMVVALALSGLRYGLFMLKLVNEMAPNSQNPYKS